RHPLENIMWDCHTQTPHDSYHAMGGKTRRLLDTTFHLLTSNGESEWLYHWKSIEKPPRWSKLPNPILHRQSFMFSDIFRLAMLMPFILKRFLTWRHIKSDALTLIKERLNLSRVDQVATRVLQVWVTEAKTLKLAFSVTMDTNAYKALEKTLREQSRLLTEVFPEDFANVPNLHLNVHLPQHAKNFATLVNTSVGVKEMVHRIFKGVVGHTNHKSIELDLIKRYNTVQALRHLVDEGEDPRFINRKWIAQVTCKEFLCKFLSGWYAVEKPLLEENNTDVEATHMVSHDPHFINIRLRKKWDRTQIVGAGFTKILDPDNTLFHHLSAAYSDDMDMKGALINRRLEFYDYVSYEVLDGEEAEERVSLRVGNVIDMKEEEEEDAFAIIRAIFCHMANNTNRY
ncbi:3948_t:CDS:2, partial [Paraglomus occultum]